MAEVKRDAFSIDEIAARAGLSRDTIEREIAAGRLRARKIGRIYRIPEKWYQEWLHREPGPAKLTIADLVKQQRAARQAHKGTLQRKQGQAGRKR